MSATIERAIDWRARAAELAPIILEYRAETERERTLPQPVFEAMARSGLFRILVPAEAGGGETDPITAYEVIEAVSRLDGAAGWNLMIGLGQGLFSAFFPPGVVREIWTANERSVTGGATIPAGRAVAVEGGYVVSGRWPFGSGGQHCSWMKGVAPIFDGDTPRGPLLLVNMPAAAVEWFDTWDALGLRGSGSHDYGATNVFVPERHTFVMGSHPPLYPGPLYRLPFAGFASGGIASCALGVGRGAFDETQRALATKVDSELGTPVRERPHVILKVARAEALLRSGRAFLREATADAWATAVAGGTPSREQAAAMVLAGTNAAQSAAQAVDLLFKAVGTTGVYAKSPLERAFRDVHTAAAHVTVQETNLEYAGRILLGMEPGVGWL